MQTTETKRTEAATGCACATDTTLGDELAEEFGSLSRRQKLELATNNLAVKYRLVLIQIDQAMPYLPAIPDAIRMLVG